MNIKFQNSARILIVDDEPANLKLLDKMLGGQGYQDLALIDDPRMVIDSYKEKRPDLILLDINLPGMNGYEMLEILRRDQATVNIPVVAVSANAMPHDLEKGEAAGFDDYLTKPVEFEHLINTLNQQLARRRMS